MDHVDGRVHVVGDQDADEEHGDVDQRLSVIAPVLALDHDVEAPGERVDDLQYGHNLDHPNHYELEPG